MVEGPVVKDTLTSDMIDAGRALIEKLTVQDLQLSAALWFYFAEQNNWKLILASQIVKAHGPRAMYKKVQSVIHADADELSNLELSDIAVVSPDEMIITQFRPAIQIAGISGVRLSNNTINGRVIEDAYIYKMTFPR